MAFMKFELLMSPSFEKIRILSILFVTTQRDPQKFPAPTAVPILAFPSSYLKVPNKRKKTVNIAFASWHVLLKNRVSDFWHKHLFICDRQLSFWNWNIQVDQSSYTFHKLIAFLTKATSHGFVGLLLLELLPCFNVFAVQIFKRFFKRNFREFLITLH